MGDRVAFELGSPDKLLLSVQAEMVVVPGADGDFAVLAGHAPMISTLRPGALEVYEGDKVTDRIYVAGGFAEVSNDRCTVLADEAVPVAYLDRAKLDARLKAAEERLAASKTDGEQYTANTTIAILRELLATAR